MNLPESGGWKVLGHDERRSIGCSIKQLAARLDYFLRINVERRIPFRLLDVDRLEDEIDEIKQRFFTRRNLDSDVAWRVPWRRDCSNSWDEFRFVFPPPRATWIRCTQPVSP
ncbi:hypothetical protein [Halalkalicoccus salilacus]|uniref:hypothetical protein n=1 Tax=Halalkalicoccus salilacus TaxID=3117459 RepID=UPI00300F79F3